LCLSYIEKLAGDTQVQQESKKKKKLIHDTNEAGGEFEI
jgi:hypothetical protein